MFDLYLIDDMPTPAESDLGDFLFQHPNYLNGQDWKTTGVFLANSAETIQDMPLGMQQLAGSLIRLTLSDEELTQIAHSPDFVMVAKD